MATMRAIAFILPSLIDGGHARRLDVGTTQSRGRSEENLQNPLSSLATVLFASPAGSSKSPMRARSGPAARAVPPSMVESALIIQNKGGGHGEIGYHLALELAKEKGMAVTILHEGPNRADRQSFEEPFTIESRPHEAYGALGEAGVDIKWFPDLQAPEAIAAVADKHFDAVVDNWSKDPEHIRPYAELAKKWGVETFAYVSSAGMYTPPEGDFTAITEDTPVKSTGQRQAEELLAEMDLPYTIFRPQYIYGPQENKCYCRFFFDRMIRSTWVPIPGDGEQKVTLTHAADAAAMIALAIGNPAAKKEIFNCATSSLVTYSELAAQCFNAVPLKHGKPLNHEPEPGDREIGRFVDNLSVICMYYDQYDEEVKERVSVQNKAFPFRETPFFVSVDKACEKLGFAPKHQFAEDVGNWYYDENYAKTSMPDEEADTSFENTMRIAWVQHDFKKKGKSDILEQFS